MTCAIRWNDIANQAIYICTAGRKYVDPKPIITNVTKKSGSSHLIALEIVIGAIALTFFLYKLYNGPLDQKGELNFKDLRGKSIQDYSLEGLRNPPKSFKMPNPLPKLLKDDLDFPLFISPKTGQLIRNPVYYCRILYEKDDIIKGHEVPKIAEFIRKKVYTYVFNTAGNKTSLKAEELRDKIEGGGDLDITDRRVKTLKAYSLEGLSEAPKGFPLPIKIPEVFENDPTYPQFFCPFTQSLIRFPVLDPTDGTTLYEQSEIEKYLEVAKASPTTREPLKEDDLVTVPNIGRYIKMRLFQFVLKQKAK